MLSKPVLRPHQVDFDNEEDSDNQTIDNIYETRGLNQNNESCQCIHRSTQPNDDSTLVIAKSKCTLVNSEDENDFSIYAHSQTIIKI